jgi:hypothetical protein
MDDSSQQPAPPGMSKIDFHLGVSVAIVAALVAVVDLANGRVGDDEIIANQEKESTYQWYQAKSIKETLAEGNRDTLVILAESGLIAQDKRDSIDRLIKAGDLEVSRYRREKNTIMDGGTLDGQNVPGATFWSTRARALADVGDALDVAMLFLHLALLLGGVGVAVQHKKLERALLKIVLTFAALGIVLAVVGAAMWIRAPTS